MTEDIAGFIGDLDLAKVDLKIIKEYFPEWYGEVASSKRCRQTSADQMGEEPSTLYKRT